MPTRPLGLFDSFDNLDSITAESVAFWLKPIPQLLQIENYLANRILYPRTLAISETDMKIDLAILREALKINGPKKGAKENSFLGGNPFLNPTLRKILIPVRFLNFTPGLPHLVLSFIDAFLLYRQKEDIYQDIWTVVITDDNDETAGTVILPQFRSNNGEVEINLANKKYKIKSNSFTIIPCPAGNCQISYSISGGTILGKQSNILEITGGKLGIAVDGRKV